MVQRLTIFSIGFAECLRFIIVPIQNIHMFSPILFKNEVAVHCGKVMVLSLEMWSKYD